MESAHAIVTLTAGLCTTSLNPHYFSLSTILPGYNTLHLRIFDEVSQTQTTQDTHSLTQLCLLKGIATDKEIAIAAIDLETVFEQQSVTQSFDLRGKQGHEGTVALQLVFHVTHTHTHILEGES